MQEARAIIASLRAQLSAASLKEQEEQAQEEEEVASLSEAKCDREVFEGIKARVVKEFGLGPEYVGKRLALNALFPPAETSFGSSQDQNDQNRLLGRQMCSTRRWHGSRATPTSWPRPTISSTTALARASYTYDSTPTARWRLSSGPCQRMLSAATC